MMCSWKHTSFHDRTYLIRTTFLLKMAGILDATIQSMLIISTRSCSRMTSSSSLVLLFFFSFFLFALVGSSVAKEHLVGGITSGWKVPSSTAESLNKWAESTRFQVGDSLVWDYDGKMDSVVQVTKRDYTSCNTSSPIREQTGGHTVMRLRRSGAYYFISGAEGACEKGEKLIVVVMSPRRVAIPPASNDGPAVAPTSGAPSSIAVALVGCFALAAALLVILQL